MGNLSILIARFNIIQWSTVRGTSEYDTRLSPQNRTTRQNTVVCTPRVVTHRLANITIVPYDFFQTQPLRPARKINDNTYCSIKHRITSPFVSHSLSNNTKPVISILDGTEALPCQLGQVRKRPSASICVK